MDQAEEGGGRSTCAEPSLDGEVAGEAVADAGLERVGDGYVVGSGEFLFDGIEQPQERGDGIGAEERVGVRGVVDRLGELGAGAIEDGRERESLVVGEGLVQLAQVGSGGWFGKIWKASARREKMSQTSSRSLRLPMASGAM